MAFVDHHQVIVAPVDGRQIDIPRPAAFAAQISVRKHRISEAVTHKRVEFAVILGLVHRPVVAQLLGAQHQHPLISQLEILDNCQRLESFAQPDAIRQDAAVVRQNLVNRALDTILLELKQCLPDFGVHHLALDVVERALVLLIQVIFKDVIQGLEVDKLRGVILVQLLQVIQHFGFHVLHQFFVIPKFFEPDFQFAFIPAIFDHQVEFHVVTFAPVQPQTTGGEVGTAHNGIFHAVGLGNVIHLPMQEARPLHRADFRFGCQPVRALARHPALFQPVCQAQLAIFNVVGFFIVLVRVK